MTATKDILTAINQARYIAFMCNTRANELTNQAKAIKYSKNVKVWINNSAKKDILLLRAELLRSRAVNVWNSVTGYQGKWINYRDIHTVDGVQYCGIINLIDASFTHASADKYTIN